LGLTFITGTLLLFFLFWRERDVSKFPLKEGEETGLLPK